MAIRVYNQVIDNLCDRCPKDELLTDKELEHCKATAFRKRDIPNTQKVKAYGLYFMFGVRFADKTELV